MRDNSKPLKYHCKYPDCDRVVGPYHSVGNASAALNDHYRIAHDENTRNVTEENAVDYLIEKPALPRGRGLWVGGVDGGRKIKGE